ncbi:MAG: hypothetical protein ACRCU3_09330 [Eubacteriaceae bacterium]
MKKKLVSAIAAAALCVSMTMPSVLATNGEVVPLPDGTDVYAGIIMDDEVDGDARIRVTVPTLFAFVVNGTKAGSPTANDPITGNVLLPNVKVNVTNPGVNNSDYSIEIVGQSSMTVTNYSTKASGTTDSGRVGIPVNLTGTIENRGTAAERNYWSHSTNATGFKEYTLSVDGKAFSNVVGTEAYAMTAPASLDAPNASATGTVDPSTQLATTGAAKNLVFDVAVGGTRGQYNQVEQSAKVGTIVWTVGYEIDNSTANNPTSPSNPPLQP